MRAGPDYRQFLDETRAELKRRRGWFRKVHAEDRLSGPMFDNDPLQKQWDENTRLLKKGAVVWAALVQANEVLFRPGRQNAPGEVILSTDSYFDDRPDELLQIASAVFDLKGTQPSDPQLRVIADEITGELARSFGKPVPEAFTDRFTSGKDLRRYTVMFDRQHFPEGVIGQRLFPVLTHNTCESVCFLPVSCWGPGLRSFWELPGEMKATLERERQQRERARKRLPMIRVTKAAVSKLSEHLTMTEFRQLVIRIGLDAGRYTLGFMNPDEIGPDDQTLQQGELLIVVSADDAEALWGTELDHVREGDVEGFMFNEFEG